MDKVLVKSQYKEKIHRRFYYFHMFRKSFSVYLLIIAIGLSIYFAVNATINFQGEESMTNLYIAWGFSALVIGMIPAFTIGRINSIIRYNRKERGDRLEIIDITKAKIVRFVDGIEGKVILGWEDFESVYETKDCFYMYIDKERGLVIDKNDIVEGSPEMLRKLAQNNLKPNRKGKVKFKKMFKDK